MLFLILFFQITSQPPTDSIRETQRPLNQTWLHTNIRRRKCKKSLFALRTFKIILSYAKQFVSR